MTSTKVIIVQSLMLVVFVDSNLPHDQRDIRIGICERLSLSDQYTQSDTYWSDDSKDIKFLFCHVTSYHHMIKVMCDLLSGSPASQVTNHPTSMLTGLVKGKMKCL